MGGGGYSPVVGVVDSRGGGVGARGVVEEVAAVGVEVAAAAVEGDEDKKLR